MTTQEQKQAAAGGWMVLCAALLAFALSWLIFGVGGKWGTWSIGFATGFLFAIGVVIGVSKLTK